MTAHTEVIHVMHAARGGECLCPSLTAATSSLVLVWVPIMDGLRLSDTSRSSRRDPAFRQEVIAAWGHKCVFCGYSVQLDSADLGLEAAHIQWCQAGGPDALNNGLACCSIHHQAFDRGAITVNSDRRILVSSRLYGGEKLQELFLALHGAEIRLPNRREAVPKVKFLSWHRAQVFRGEARD
jgi:putative restriction endonuclease